MPAYHLFPSTLVWLNGSKWERLRSKSRAFILSVWAFAIPALALVLSEASVKGQTLDWQVVSPAFSGGYATNLEIDPQGRLVAVGSSGLIGVSQDGLGWERIASPTTESLSEVMRTEDGVYIAGQSGIVLFSIDGDDYAVVHDPDSEINNYAVGLAAGGGSIVVMIASGETFRSEDGVNWVKGHLNPNDSSLWMGDLAYGNGRYVAVGSTISGREAVYTSEDGVAWQLRTKERIFDGNRFYNSSRLTTVIHANGRFLAVGEYSAAAASADGITWTSLRRDDVLAAGSVSSLTYSKGKFYASTEAGLRVSSDGAEWVPLGEAGDPPTFSIGRMVSRQGVLYGVGGGVTKRRVDGVWESRATSVRPTFLHVASGGGLTVAPDGGAGLYSSHDGLRWDYSTIDGMTSIQRVAFGGGSFMLLDGTPKAALWNPQSSQATVSDLPFQASDLVYSGDKWVVTAGSKMATSSDGVTWSDTLVATGVNVSRLAYGGGRFVGVGSNVAYSDDGETWSLASDPPYIGPYSLILSGVAYGNGRFVAMASNGLNGWYSEDGDVWTPVDWSAVNIGYPHLTKFKSISFNNGVFIAYARTSAFVSTDGVSWTIQENVFYNGVGDHYQFAYANGRWLAVGYIGFIYATSANEFSPRIEPSSELVGSGAAGDLVDLSVAAIGEDLEYQWYQGESGDKSSPVAGATAADLKVTVGESADTYWAQVSNTVGSTLSETYWVVPGSAPTVDLTETWYEAKVGTSFYVAAAVGGIPYPDLQWYRGESGDTSDPVPGQTGSSVSLTAAVEGSGRYWLRAANSNGQTDSPSVTVVPWEVTEARRLFDSITSYGDGFLGVVGDTISRSAEGLHWETIETISQAYFGDIATLGSRAIAVGQGGTYTSEDLETWTKQEGVSRALRVATGGGVAVAVLPGLNTSPDGVTWQNLSLPSNVALWDVAYHQGAFIAVGGELPSGQTREREVIYRSTDGQSWQRLGFDGQLPASGTGYSSHLARVEVFGDALFAVCPDIPRFYRSVDGVSWEGYDLDDQFIGRLEFVAKLGDQFVAVGPSGSATSIDGISWKPGPGFGTDGLLVPWGETVRWYAGDRSILESADGQTWDRVGGILDLRQVAFGAGRFFGTGSVGDDFGYESVDGLVWRPQPGVKLPVQRHLFYADGEFVIGEEIPLRTDGDGLWREIVEFAHDAGGSSVGKVGGAFVRLPGYTTQLTQGNGVYVASGRGIWYSTDLSAWTQITTYATSYGKVFFANGRFIATGYKASSGQYYMTSTDGATWTQQAAPALPDVSGIELLEYHGGRYYLASGTRFWTSRDLENWSQVWGVSPPDLGVYGNGETLFFSTGPVQIRRMWDGQSPRLLSQSEDVFGEIGSTAALSVDTAGTDLVFQWYRGKSGDTSEPLSSPGADSARTEVTVEAAEKTYWVRVVGGGVTEDSVAVPVSAYRSPKLVRPPEPFGGSQYAAQADLSVEAEGPGVLSYQWYQGNTGDTSHPVVGGNRSTLTVSIPEGLGRYWVRVTSPYGWTDSASVPVEKWETALFSTSLNLVSTNAAAFGQGKFVVAARSVPGGIPSSNGVAISTDARAWTFHETGVGLSGLSFGAGRFVGYDFGSPQSVYGSADGLSWSMLQIGNSAGISWMRWEGDRFILATQDGGLFWSLDGLTWSTHNAFGVEWTHVVSVGGEYWGVLVDGRLMRSPNLSSWQTQSKPASMGGPLSAVELKGKLVVFDNNRRTFERSPSGTWSLLPYSDGGLPFMASTPQQAQATAGRVSVGFPYDLNWTEDGVHWWRGGGNASAFAQGNGVAITVRGSSQYALGLVTPPDSNQPGNQFYTAPRVSLRQDHVIATEGLAFELSATAAGGGLDFQWRKDGVAIDGATGVTLRVSTPTLADAGRYDVKVSNGLGEVISSPAEIRVNAAAVSPATGLQTVERRRFQADEVIHVQNTVNVNEALDTLTWSLLVPADWTAAVGDESAGGLVTLSAGLAEWTWDRPAAGSFTFDYRLTAPGDALGASVFTSLLTSRLGSIEVLSLAAPDPLILRAASSLHSADVDADSRLSLSELLRVIELYNTRTGSTRTGRYQVDAETADGFDPDALGGAGSLSRYHSADTDANGQLSLSELLRVIELYNTRTGTTRTGAYRPKEGTSDGFEAAAL